MRLGHLPLKTLQSLEYKADPIYLTEGSPKSPSMASSVLIGQAALCALPPAPIHGSENEETISTYELPVQLKISQNQAKKKGTGSGVLGNGMDVYKVSKVRTCFREMHDYTYT